MSVPTVTKMIPYGTNTSHLRSPLPYIDYLTGMVTVRLGKSGLKVSRIILGMMSYGDTRWRPWVLGEQDAIEHVKFA
jgi:hypothetical protein